MTVRELIAQLSKCEPTADVVFCYDDNDQADVVDFVENCLTEKSVFLYKGEPDWDAPIDGRDIELASISTHGNFAETTYRDL